MYEHILEIHMKDGEWLFLHFNQVLEQKDWNRLERFLGVAVDHSFPDPAIPRSFSSDPVPETTGRVYQRLCGLAGYNGK